MTNSMQLHFKQQSLTAIEQNHQFYISATDLANALGYKSEKSVSNLFNRNKDEFTEDMSLVINMMTNGINNSQRVKDVRFFSLRGAHLVAMFSRSTIAKEFRKWVLDVLDEETGQPTPSYTSTVENPFLELSHDQARFLRTMLRVSDKLEVRGMETRLEVKAMRQQVQMMKQLCDDLDSKVTAFEHRIMFDLDVVQHIRLYRSLMTRGDENQVLNSYINEPY